MIVIIRRLKVVVAWGWGKDEAIPEAAYAEVFARSIVRDFRLVKLVVARSAPRSIIVPLHATVTELKIRRGMSQNLVGEEAFLAAQKRRVYVFGYVIDRPCKYLFSCI